MPPGERVWPPSRLSLSLLVRLRQSLASSHQSRRRARPPSHCRYRRGRLQCHPQGQALPFASVVVCSAQQLPPWPPLSQSVTRARQGPTSLLAQFALQKDLSPPRASPRASCRPRWRHRLLHRASSGHWLCETCALPARVSASVSVPASGAAATRVQIATSALGALQKSGPPRVDGHRLCWFLSHAWSLSSKNETGRVCVPVPKVSNRLFLTHTLFHVLCPNIQKRRRAGRRTVVEALQRLHMRVSQLPTYRKSHIFHVLL